MQSQYLLLIPPARLVTDFYVVSQESSEGKTQRCFFNIFIPGQWSETLLKQEEWVVTASLDKVCSVHL